MRNAQHGPESIFFPQSGESRPQSTPDSRQARYIHWLVSLRWLACLGTGAAILLIWLLGSLEHTGLVWLTVLLGGLVATNALYIYLLRRLTRLDRLVQVQIVGDLVILSLMLHFSGGLENPLSFLGVFHIIISGILLPRFQAYQMLALAMVLISALAIAEMRGIIPHYTLDLFPHPELHAPVPASEPSAESAKDGHAEEKREHDDERIGHAASSQHGKVMHASLDSSFVYSQIFRHFLLLSLTCFFTLSIMERLRAEEDNLRASRRHLERVVETTAVALAVFEKDLSITWLSRASAVHGGSRVAIEDLQKWIGGEDGPAAATLKDATHRVVEREVVDREDGKKYHYQITLAPVHSERGVLTEVALLVQDVTSRKHAEAEIMHADKMGTLGFLAAGIVHEVGNPLASISTRLQLMEAKKDDTSFLQQSIEPIRKQISRIMRILHGIREFSRPTRSEWTTCHIETLLNETLDVLSMHVLAKRCRIETAIDPDLPTTAGVQDQLVQLFVNLGMNALDAMPGGGRLLISASREGGNLKITFEDSGGGMSETVRRRVFDAFFTTKEGGLGIGLSLSRNLINAHGGSLDVESEEGVGSRFTVTLPIRTGGRIGENLA